MGTKGICFALAILVLRGNCQLFVPCRERGTIDGNFSIGTRDDINFMYYKQEMLTATKTLFHGIPNLVSVTDVSPEFNGVTSSVAEDRAELAEYLFKGQSLLVINYGAEPPNVTTIPVRQRFSALAQVENVHAAANLQGGFIFAGSSSVEGGFRQMQIGAFINGEEAENRASNVTRTSYDDQFPSEMVYLDSGSGGQRRLLVFFIEIVGVYTVDLNRNIPIIKVDTSVDYQSSRPWLGCAPELCFDAIIDAAATIGSNMRVYRGNFFWDINLTSTLETPASRLIALSRERFPLAALVFTDANPPQRFVIHRQNVQLFPELATSTIDAAFTFPNVHYIITTDTFTRYAFNRGSGTFSRRGELQQPLSVFFAGLPSDLDAAATNFAIDSSLRFWFFKNNFLFEAIGSEPGTRISSVRLIQGNLITCPDSFYANSAATKPLRLSTYASFAQYRNQFRPIVPGTPTVAPDTTTRSTVAPPSTRVQPLPPEEPTRTFPTNNSMPSSLFLPLIIIVSLVLIVALLIGLICLYDCKTKSIVSTVARPNEPITWTTNDTTNDLTTASMKPMDGEVIVSKATVVSNRSTASKNV